MEAESLPHTVGWQTIVPQTCLNTPERTIVGGCSMTSHWLYTLYGGAS